MPETSILEQTGTDWMPEKRVPETADVKTPVLQPPLPTISHLQFLVLDQFRSDSVEVSAQELQHALLAAGVEQRGPKFYQLMKRLEESGLVTSWQKGFSVAGSEVNRSFYRLTKEGIVAWRLTREFYAIRRKAKNTIGKSGDRANEKR